MITAKQMRRATKALRGFSVRPKDYGKPLPPLIDENGVIVLRDSKYLRGYMHVGSLLDIEGENYLRALAEMQGNVNPKWVESTIEWWKKQRSK